MKLGSIKGRKPLWVAIIAIVAWLGISSVAGPTFGKLSTVQENDNSGFLPDNAESTKTAKVTVKFADSANDQLPTLLLFVGDLDIAKLARINQYLATLSNKKIPGTEISLSQYIIPGSLLAAFPSQDGKAALANIPLDSKVATENIDDKPALPQIIKFIRTDLAANFDSQGLTTNVTGFGGILADLFGAFGSIDSTLLLNNKLRFQLTRAR